MMRNDEDSQHMAKVYSRYGWHWHGHAYSTHERKAHVQSSRLWQVRLDVKQCTTTRSCSRQIMRVIARFNACVDGDFELLVAPSDEDFSIENSNTST